MRTHVDDILITCRFCDDYFTIESMRNGTEATYVCTSCGGRILVKILDGGEKKNVE